jgi:ABC-type multidrug transport system permease subunit
MDVGRDSSMWPLGVCVSICSCVCYIALHWVPVPMPMPTHTHRFWVGMGAMLFSWVGMGAILLFMSGHQFCHNNNNLCNTCLNEASEKSIGMYAKSIY